MKFDWIGFVGPQYDSWDSTSREADLAGITVARFRQDWSSMNSNDDFEICLSSEGGYTDIGVSIMNLVASESKAKRILNSDFKSICHVIGTAYSAASLIAMGFDEVVMHTGAEMMIHKASTYCWGNADQMRKTVALLDEIDAAILDVYSQRTGMSKDDINTLLSAETYMSADEAVKLKFATSKQTLACRVAPPTRTANWNYQEHIGRQVRHVNGTFAFVTSKKPSCQASPETTSKLKAMCNDAARTSGS
jgi:ATP-dependent protease ClpP protease subunit